MPGDRQAIAVGGQCPYQVALRVLHSLVHLTYDNLRQRMGLFALSNLVVIVMWVFFFVQPMMG